jgi:hypothetical protein
MKPRASYILGKHKTTELHPRSISMNYLVATFCPSHNAQNLCFFSSFNYSAIILPYRIIINLLCVRYSIYKDNQGMYPFAFSYWYLLYLGVSGIEPRILYLPKHSTTELHLSLYFIFTLNHWTHDIAKCFYHKNFKNPIDWYCVNASRKKKNRSQKF